MKLEQRTHWSVSWNNDNGEKSTADRTKIDSFCHDRDPKRKKLKPQIITKCNVRSLSLSPSRPLYRSLALAHLSLNCALHIQSTPTVACLLKTAFSYLILGIFFCCSTRVNVPLHNDDNYVQRKYNFFSLSDFMLLCSGFRAKIMFAIENKTDTKKVCSFN